MRKTFESIDFEALAERASTVRARLDPNSTAQPSCQINRSKFAVGWYNIVFEVAFQDGTYWIARIRREPEIKENLGIESERIKEMESEVYTMAYVKENSTIPTPKVFDFRAQKDPIVGCRYILMEALPGRPSPDRLRDFIPNQYKPKTYSQLADIKMQLSQLRFPKIGRLCGTGFGEDAKFTIDAFQPPGCLYAPSSGPYDTALEYYYEIRRTDFERALEKASEELCIGAWLRVQAIPSIVQRQFNHGPFPLHHPDLGCDNLLFDNNYNITGIIDWTHAAVVPVESFCVMPLEFPRYNPSGSFSDNLIWNVLEERERSINPFTPLSRYMQSPESTAIPFFDMGDSRNPVIVKQYSEALIRRLYGQETTYDQVKNMYRGSTLLKEPCKGMVR